MFSVSESRVKFWAKDEARIASGMLAVDRFPPLCADRGWGARLKVGGGKKGGIWEYSLSSPQPAVDYSTQLEKDTGSP